MSIKKNITANFFGSIWTALMSLAFIPYYIKLMGVESYGLIGFMASIQAIAILLDLGLAQSLNRELAKLSINPDNGEWVWWDVQNLEIVVPPISDPYKLANIMAKISFQSYNLSEPIIFRLYFIFFFSNFCSFKAFFFPIIFTP
jgi:hypothetical protein